MLDELLLLSQNFINIYNKKYIRYFLKTNALSNRFSIITGQRGIGKTTTMIQYILLRYEEDTYTSKALYIQADHFVVGKYSLYEIAEEFYNYGGELICIDEIHKYPNWAKEIKSIFDTFTKLKIVASGSSAMEITKASHDLSRRAVGYKMYGFSLREYLELTLSITLNKYSLEEILKDHQKIANAVLKKISGKGNKILSLFKSYLEFGYYPYYLEFPDINHYYITLEQNIHATLENDLVNIYPHLTGNSIKKIKKLLSIIASLVPFTPDLKKLKLLLDIGDERTLKVYLKYLEDSGIILMTSKGKKGFKELEKPEKIYLNNTNLIYSLTTANNVEIGNVRETFFINIFNAQHKISTPEKGDFLVDNKYTIEVGGKSKDFAQIKNIKNSFLAIDNIEIGISNKIPLWLFGFLY
ncbi:MAG: AAA family ATPase [Cytophagales bacterium]|nr:AAA family ATPase [Cytophagales bacterium]